MVVPHAETADTAASASTAPLPAFRLHDTPYIETTEERRAAAITAELALAHFDHARAAIAPAYGAAALEPMNLNLMLQR